MTKDELIEELIAAVRENQAAVDKMDEAGAEALGVNRTDGRCLDVIQRLGGAGVGELARGAGLTAGAATTAVDRLEAKGYVRRVPDPADRRRVRVELTPLVARRAAAVWGPLGERGRPAIARYGAGELRLLIEFQRLGTALNEQRTAELRAEREVARAAGASASSPPRGRARPGEPSAAPGAPPAS